MEELGITVEFRGETTQFEGAVKKVNNELKATKADLSLINKQLKLDPTSVDKLKDKMKALKDLQSELTEKVDTYKQAMEGLDRGSDEWSKLNKELQKAQVDLEKLNKELKEMPSAPIQAVSKSLADMEKKLKGASESVGKVASKFAVFSAAAVGLGTAGVKFNAQLEQYRTAFTTLIGDAEKANQAIANIQSDAAATPFDTDSLVQANQYLIAAGVDAEQARQTIMALGDAIAATGGGSNELSRMAQNLQQIKNVGKASAQDIKQFANAGINIYGLLAQTTGKTVEEIQKMDISFDVLNEALTKASQEGGVYFGAMANQSETLNGSISTLKDSFNILLGELTESLVPIIKSVIKYVNNLITRLRAMTPQQKQMITILGVIIALITPVAAVIAKILGTLSSLSGVLSTLIPKIAGMINPFTIILGILISLYASNEDFRKSVNKLAKQIWEYVKPALSDLWEIATSVWNILKKVVSIVKDLWDQFKKTSIGQGFLTMLQAIGEFLVGFARDLATVINKVKDLFKWFEKVLGISEKVGKINVVKPAQIAQGNYDMVQSGGYGSINSGGYSGITLNASFNVNSNNIGRQQVKEWSSWIVDDLNEALGKAI